MQIRAQFQLPDDLTEEEKLEPVRNFGDDPKIRLLNRLYEKKRRVRAPVLCAVGVHSRADLATDLGVLDTMRIVSAWRCSERPCNTDLCAPILVLKWLMGSARACRRQPRSCSPPRPPHDSLATRR